MTTDHDPRPIPEHSPEYDGHNAEEIMAWVHQTMEHYEREHRYMGHVANESNLHVRNPYVQPASQVSIEIGQSLTYSESAGGLVPRPHEPEVLVRDHPQTVAERMLVQDAQRKLGVSVPEPGRSDFVGRRASGVSFDSPTVVPTAGAALEAAMNRHPSGQYAAVSSPSINPGKPVHHLPPRIH